MRKFLSAVLLFCCSISYSQIAFEKGYFINNDGIRVPCLIENIDWQNNPKSFNYKFTEDGEVKIENLYGAREFGIDNVSQYKRFTVNVERSANDMKSLTKNKIAEFKQETHFFKALVTGEASLYVLNDANVIKYFYETKDTPTEQLVRIKYISSEYSRTIDSYSETVMENNLFRQQLLNKLKCADLSESDFKNLEYNKNALTKVFAKYNNCAGQGTAGVATVNFTEKDKRKSIALKITPGIYAGSLSITDPATAYNVSTDQNSVAFKLGAEFEYILPFNKDTWSLFVNPTYQKFDAENTYTKSDGINNSTNTVTYTAKTKYTSVEIPLGLRRYFFLNTSSKIFVNLAYVIDVNLGDSQIAFTSPKGGNTNKTLSVDSRNNIAVGAGFVYKRFSAEIRANLSREILGNYLSWNAKYTTNGLTLGYTLF